MIWSYLRRKVRESILAGVSDALVEIEGNDSSGANGSGANGSSTTDTTGALAILRAKLTPALPAPAATHSPDAETAIPATRITQDASNDAEGTDSPSSPQPRQRKRGTPAAA